MRLGSTTHAHTRTLRSIFPSVDASGHRVSIPMPGHPVSAAELPQVMSDVERLSGLVDSHDVIFLLTGDAVMSV